MFRWPLRESVSYSGSVSELTGSGFRVEMLLLDGTVDGHGGHECLGRRFLNGDFHEESSGCSVDVSDSGTGSGRGHCDIG